MAAWSKKSFDSVRDTSPKDVDMQWRMARTSMGFEQVGVSRFTYGPGVRFPYAHHHGEQEEAFVVIAGSGRGKLDDEVVDLEVGDVIRVSPPVVRQFEAGSDGMELICIGGPLPKGGKSDGVRDEDFWD